MPWWPAWPGHGLAIYIPCVIGLSSSRTPTTLADHAYCSLLNLLTPATLSPRPSRSTSSSPRPKRTRAAAAAPRAARVLLLVSQRLRRGVAPTMPSSAIPTIPVAMPSLTSVLPRPHRYPCTADPSHLLLLRRRPPLLRALRPRHAHNRDRDTIPYPCPLRVLMTPPLRPPPVPDPACSVPLLAPRFRLGRVLAPSRVSVCVRAP